eukprot:EG_transcript_46368
MSAPASTFPDLSAFQEEKATKRWYDWAAKDWHTAPITVRIAGQPFTQGDTYIVHHALLHDTDGAEHQCVVKKSKDQRRSSRGPSQCTTTGAVAYRGLAPRLGL